jgi:hypothetical protein
MYQMTLEESYKRSCEKGQFFIDKSYRWGGNDGLTQIHDGYYILFLAQDGQRVVKCLSKSEGKKAQTICDKLNSLGSVEKVDEFRQSLTEK